MELLTDNALMLKVKNGDLDKMDLLFRRYHRPLFGFLYRMTSQREASEDMVQNVFYRMLRSRHTFTGKGEFKTWMYHLARNVLKDHLKKNSKNAGHYDISEFAERISGGIGANEAIEKNQEWNILQNALSKLNEENREVLILSRFQEMKYHEIATIMNITEGAVKVRIHRAMTQLKTCIQKLNRMKCDYDKTQIMHWINNEMTGVEKETFEKHLNDCAACRQELRAHEYLWELMEQIPVPDPSDNMHPRFQSMLDTFKESAEEKKGSFAMIIEKIKQSWILQPRMQLAYGIVLILIALGGGYLFSRINQGSNYKQQIDSLSSQVHEMREMMTLSLLENPSASERIRGVSYTAEIKAANKQVIDALLTTLNNDPNVNVRLLTLDALTHFAGDAGVREGLVQSIVQQESPLVQSAMADVMLKLQEKRSIQPFKKLLMQKQLNTMVKSKIEQTINRLI